MRLSPLVVALLMLALPADAQSLQERIEQCASCHGPDGNSRIEKMPSLAGQPEFFLLNQLILMREGVRRIETMTPFVKGLTDGEIEAMARHFASLEPKSSGETVNPGLVARGAELAGKLHCYSCHLPTLAGQNQMPRLAKQRLDYMIDALKAIRDNKRSGADTLMSASIYGVSDADLVALAHYATSR